MTLTTILYSTICIKIVTIVLRRLYFKINRIVTISIVCDWGLKLKVVDIFSYYWNNFYTLWIPNDSKRKCVLKYCVDWIWIDFVMPNITTNEPVRIKIFHKKNISRRRGTYRSYFKNEVDYFWCTKPRKVSNHWYGYSIATIRVCSMVPDEVGILNPR